MRKTQRKENNKLHFSKMIPGPYGAHGVKEMFLVQKQKITV